MSGVRTKNEQSASPDAEDERGESEAERLDRNYGELLQELRVTQTGVQILFAFLLTLAFTQRFAQITSFQRGTYVVTLLFAAGAAALLIGPVSFHRHRLPARPEGRRWSSPPTGWRSAAWPSCWSRSSGAVLLILDVTLGRGPALWY